MSALFLAALLLLQGIPITAAQSGKVSGVLKAPDGSPLAGVRIAAVVQPETLEDRTSAAMSGLAETDDQGRFAIEGLPQGRYYIAAGRVDFPTYYPGTMEIARARIVTVMPGTAVTDIEFSMFDASTRPEVDRFSSLSGLLAAAIKISVPLQVRGAAGGKIPIFSDGKFSMVRLIGSSVSLATTARFGDPSIEVGGGDYDIVIENLPAGYAVQSITYGAIDLMKSRLRIPMVFANASGTTTTLSGSTANPVPPLSTIVIVLKSAPAAPPISGVRVSGSATDGLARSVYLSGSPGTYYTDGTFEFNNVPPGVHVLAGLDTPAPLGAFVVVGNQNVDGVALRDDTAVLPVNLRSPREPEPIGAHQPSTVLPLPSLKGVIREQVSKKPLEGALKITGYARSQSLMTDADGRFEIPRLFPGSYTLEFELFGHTAITETVTIGSENVSLDLTSQRLY
jgi:hypothetical protein